MTGRGRTLLVVGVIAIAVGIALGQRDVVRVGVLVAALPLLAALIVARSRYRVELVRTIDPARVPIGTVATVRLQIANLSRLRTGVLLAEETLPPALGPHPRFVVDRLNPGDGAAISYRVGSQERGRWQIGPVRFRLTDPFGLVEITRSFTATDPLTVIPTVHPLTDLGASGTWRGAGDSVQRTAAASGDHDVAVREYRHGDDLRRVHWRSTARRGELMVRRDEQPHQQQATVLLDLRANGHRGTGPANSEEWAVSAAASVASHLVTTGYGVRVVSDGTDPGWSGRDHPGGVGGLLDRLATARPAGRATLSQAIDLVTRAGGDGLVVAILGEIGPDPVRALAALPRAGTAGVALLLETTSWTTLPTGAAAEIDTARGRAGHLLEANGWVVVHVRADDTIPRAWARLAARHGAHTAAVGLSS